MNPVTSRYDTAMVSCPAPGCTKDVPRNTTGRPARYCSTACRVRAHRARQRRANPPVTVEVDKGSTSSRNRPADRAWLVRLHRRDRSVIIAIGLRRNAADRLAEQIADLLNPNAAHEKA